MGQHPRSWICALLVVLNPEARRKKTVQARLSLGGDEMGVGVGVGSLQDCKQRDGITRLVLQKNAAKIEMPATKQLGGSQRL